MIATVATMKIHSSSVRLSLGKKMKKVTASSLSDGLHHPRKVLSTPIMTTNTCVDARKAIIHFFARLS